jgi:hypothetical protein
MKTLTYCTTELQDFLYKDKVTILLGLELIFLERVNRRRMYTEFIWLRKISGVGLF